jgi:hypothetical protein
MAHLAPHFAHERRSESQKPSRRSQIDPPSNSSVAVSVSFYASLSMIMTTKNNVPLRYGEIRSKSPVQGQGAMSVIRFLIGHKKREEDARAS